MGKTQLALELSKRNPELNKTKCYKLISDLFDIIEEEVVEKGNKIILKGFGTFYKYEIKEKRRNGKGYCKPAKYIKMKATMRKYL